MNAATTCFAILLFSSLPLTAQTEGDNSGVPPGGVPKVRYEQRHEGTFEILEFADGRMEERMIPKEEADLMRKERKEAFDMIKSERLFHCSAFPKPRRVPPGQGGELQVVVTLTKPHVVLPNSHIKLKLESNEKIRLGMPVLEPTRLGEIEKAFKGKLVYDDTMLFKLPFTVLAKAKMNEPIFLRGRMELELHDGKSGSRLGKYWTEAGGRVDVGPPVPNPVVRPSGAAGAGQTGGATNATPPPEDDAVAGAKDPNAATKGSEPAGDAESRIERAAGPDQGPPQGTGPGPSDPLVDTPSGGVSLMTWVFGGAIVLLLGLILAVRRR